MHVKGVCLKISIVKPFVYFLFINEVYWSSLISTNDTNWPFLVLDASGNINSGYLEGNVFLMGNVFACLDIVEEMPYLRSEERILPRVE